MKITEYKPNIKLNKIIYSYYFIQNHASTHDNIPPLGHPVIQFHLKNNINTFFSNYEFPVEEVMIVGQLSKFAKINNTEQSAMIGVNLKPTALHKLIGGSMSKFTDTGIPASNYFSNEIYNLLGALKAGKSDTEKVHFLDKYFITLLDNKPARHDKFDAMIDRIIEKKGRITLEEIETACPISERTRQRYFSERLGLSLKTYLRVIRNLNFFRLLNENPSKTIPDIIFEVGYYDYSHFIKDFKLMTGTTPQRYFSNNEAFLKKFLQL
ncbi:MAG: AraC family transcriptional regulator [Bacteroidales bacterium]|nr:AraC family transcriptional regulator [Bacteroidales bacterium]